MMDFLACGFEDVSSNNHFEEKLLYKMDTGKDFLQNVSENEFLNLIYRQMISGIHHTRNYFLHECEDVLLKYTLY